MFGPPRAETRFILDGEPYDVVPESGADVAGCLSQGDWAGIVPGMVPAGQRAELAARLEDDFDALDLPDLFAVAVGVAQEMTGQPYAAAMRLCAVAVAHWSLFDGWCLRHGFDPQEAPAHRIVSAALGWLRDGAKDDKDWRRVEAALYAPLPGQAAVVPLWTAAEEEAGFMALAGAAGTPVPAVP